MADAKECDRCGVFYPISMDKPKTYGLIELEEGKPYPPPRLEPFSPDDYAGWNIKDLCPQCRKELKIWFEKINKPKAEKELKPEKEPKPVKKKPSTRKYNMSPKQRKLKRDRAIQRTVLAKELREKDPSLTWNLAMTKAAKQMKNNVSNFEEIPKIPVFPRSEPGSAFYSMPKVQHKEPEWNVKKTEDTIKTPKEIDAGLEEMPLEEYKCSTCKIEEVEEKDGICGNCDAGFEAMNNGGKPST